MQPPAISDINLRRRGRWLFTHTRYWADNAEISLLRKAVNLLDRT
jgi:hypothetical protein